LALFDRRRSERVKVLRLPAAKNLHNSCHVAVD